MIDCDRDSTFNTGRTLFPSRITARWPARYANARRNFKLSLRPGLRGVHYWSGSVSSAYEFPTGPRDDYHYASQITSRAGINLRAPFPFLFPLSRFLPVDLVHRGGNYPIGVDRNLSIGRRYSDSLRAKIGNRSCPGLSGDLRLRYAILKTRDKSSSDTHSPGGKCHLSCNSDEKSYCIRISISRRGPIHQCKCIYRKSNARHGI